MPNLKGAAEMVGKLLKAKAAIPDRLEAALYAEAQLMMTEAKRRCPVASDGGILRASGQVSQPIRDGKTVKILLSFGGAADAYAIAVHETPSEHDPPSWQAMYSSGRTIEWTSTGTGPKFLESVVREWMPMLNQRLAARMKDNL